MDFLRSTEKDPLSAKYSSFPGWHSSHIYQRRPSSAPEPEPWMTSGSGTSWDIQDVNKQSEISPTKLTTSQTDYTGKVRREKLRSTKGRYIERDIYEQREGWESTWPMNCRGQREPELQDYASLYHHTLSNKTSGFEVGEWRSAVEKGWGCGQWGFRAETEEQNHRERNWSTWDSRNMERIPPMVSFRQPPSYTAPPAYSSPKDGERAARMETFREQTSESRRVDFTDPTEACRNPSGNDGRYLQQNNQTQNAESYGGGQASNPASVMRYTAIRTNPPSPQTQLQYWESSEITCPDIPRTKQTKLARRKGGETVFCLVSRMGEVSGLSSSPEEPLKSHVLPLLTDSKPDDMTSTADNRLKQDEHLKTDEAAMSGEYGPTALEHTGGDPRARSIPDVSNESKPDGHKQELQCDDSQSRCLAMEANRHEKAYKEVMEKFPLWKEPKYQHHLTGRTRQSQEVNDNSIADKSTKDQPKSLMLIDATRVVVKVELVLLPEKEHVQYVCLTEDSPFPGTEEGTDVLASQETPENCPLDKGEERILGIAHEYLQTYEERISPSVPVDPVKEPEGSPSAAVETVEDWPELENQLVEGQPWSGTTLENNEGFEETLNMMKVGNQTTAEEPEAALEDFAALANAKATCEVSRVQTEKTTVPTDQENGPTVDDSVVTHGSERDNENQQEDTLPKDSIEANLSDEADDRGELVLDKPLQTRAENAIKEIQLDGHKVVLSSTVGFRRSRSSPHLLFASVSEPWDGSHSEEESRTLPPSTNTNGSHYSSLPSLLSPASEYSPLSKTRSMPAEALLCTSSPPEHKREVQQAMSLWDAVSRIRKHTAPDSETEEEEADADSHDQRRSTEQ